MAAGRTTTRMSGKSITKLVSVIEVFQIMVLLVLHKPDDARARPRKYFSADTVYSEFGEDKYDLNIYLDDHIVREVGTYLDTLGLELTHRRSLLFYLRCMLRAARQERRTCSLGTL
jgi:hypothetical protein